MRKLENLINSFKQRGQEIAIIDKNRFFSYVDLYKKIHENIEFLDKKIDSGSLAQLVGDFSFEMIAMFFALALKSCILAPLTSNVETYINSDVKNINANYQIRIDHARSVKINEISKDNKYSPLINELAIKNHPGLVLRSSGSTGDPKIILHDFLRLLPDKRGLGSKNRVLPILMFDHIGGINALFVNLSTGNTLVFPENRSPIEVSKLITDFDVNAIIVTPTFLKLMLLQDAFSNIVTEKLKHINYSGEIMPDYILHKLKCILPKCKFTQSYGMSELGIIGRGSENSGIDFKNDEVKYRVRGQVLEIRSQSSMLGYLNEENSQLESGWFETGDVVDISQGRLKIIGRKSEVINIGSEKVIPIEVEDVLLRMDEVKEALVRGEPHCILGNIVTAKVSLHDSLSHTEFVKRMHHFCRSYLPKFKIPQKIIITNHIEHTDRYKRVTTNFIG